MDVLQRITRQFFDLYRSMSPSQRGTLIVVPLLVVGGFMWLLYEQRDGGTTALSYGKVFTSEEIIAAEQALIQDGLTNFRREGQRLLVPVAEVDRYNAALVQFDAVPSDMGSQLLKQYESLGPFSTEKERQERREAMLLQEVRRVIRAVPDIDDARVAIASPAQKSWSQRRRVTANVTLKPRSGREVSRKLVTSIQAAVASMVPDLNPVDVTVFDVSTGVTHAQDAADDPFDNKLVQRIDDFQRQYQRKIEQDLSYIPDVGVTVHVDVDNLKSSITRNQIVDPKKIAPVFSQETSVKDAQRQQPARGEPGQVANRPGSVAATHGIERDRTFSDGSTQAVNGLSFEVTEKQIIAAMPRAVQVSVAIPRDYYRNVAAQRKAAGESDAKALDPVEIEKSVTAAVTASVRALIPTDSPTTALVVNSVDRVVPTPPALVVPFTDQLIEWGRRWGGAALLAAFALFALRTLRKATPLAPPELLPPEISSPVGSVKQSGQPVGVTAADEVPREPTRRDLIQNLVRDNPEATAAVLSKWLQAAK
jgi:flagellar M-ring protein FliF